jgi:hypothetical protein
MKAPTLKGLLILFFAVFVVWYVLPPRRPAFVPDDAVRLPTVKGNYYEKCTVDRTANVNRCTVFVVKEASTGIPAFDNEVFRPYDGGSAVNADQLKIVECKYDRGPMVICLSNGRTLIAESYWNVTKPSLDADKSWPRPSTR